MLRRLIVAAFVVVVLALAALAGVMYWLLARDGVRVALERQASAWLGQPVHIGAARPRFLPQPGLRLEQVQVGDPVRLTLGTIDVSANGRALLSRRIEHASILVTDSRIDMPLPFALPGGGSPGGGPAAGAGNAGDGGSGSAGGIELVSIDTITLRDVVIASRGRELTVSAESSLTGLGSGDGQRRGAAGAQPRLVLRQLSARTAGTRLEAEGEVDLAPRVDARLKVKANQLDVDELLALAGAFAPAAPATSAPSARAAAREPVRIAARISSETATAGGVTVRQFATDLEVDGTRVALSPLTFQLFGGRYQGSVAATLDEAITATLRARILDLDVAQLAEFGGSPGTITGRLTGAGTFTGRGADFASVLSSAQGEGTASIANGSIKGLSLVRTVVLFFGRPAPDAGASSDRFERLDATFALRNQVITAEALSMHSADADVVGSGTLSLETKALDGRLDLSLSEALTKQAGTDLARYTREGNRIVLPARIGGTLEQPRLTIDAAAAVTRGLRNEVQRRLEGILDRFRQPATPAP